MEGVLKDLEGKKLTKKKLFDILAELNLEELFGKGAAVKPKPTPVEKVVISAPLPPPDIKCTACSDTFATTGSLNRHHKRNPACVSWIAKSKEPANVSPLTKGIHLVIDDIMHKAIAKEGKLECKFCSSTFANNGNLHKHFNTASVCNQLAFQDFKKLVAEF
jgi:hypothetical protein